MKSQETAQTPKPAALVALNKWRADMGISNPTCWRWRRAGWLQTINISGRVYVTAAAIAEFTRRAEAGEFSKVHTVPAKQKGGAL